MNQLSRKVYSSVVPTLATVTASATSVPVDMIIREGTPVRSPCSHSTYAPFSTCSADDPSRVGVTYKRGRGIEGKERHGEEVMSVQCRRIV